MEIADPAVTEVITDELALLNRLAPLRAQRILEVGCGAAVLSRKLLAAYPDCRVAALEVDRIQHARNLAAPPTSGLTFVAAGAQAIAFDSASFDLALMLKSLHHVPLELMDQGLAEVRRVLRPGGHLYVSEPVFAGPLNEINRLFNDEQAVRRAAYQALRRAAQGGGWREVTEHHFQMPVRYADFADFECRSTGVTFADRRWSAETRERVRQRFEVLRPPSGQPFMRPMRVNLLQKT